MSQKIPTIGSRTAKQVSLLVKGEAFLVLASDRRFSAVFDTLRDKRDDDDLEDVLYDILTSDPLSKLSQDSDGKIELRGNVIYYEGEQVHSLVADRIIELYQDGLDIEPMMNFLKRLMDNPSKHVVDKLYSYLERGGLHIAEDGQFLAYKRVGADLASWHRNKDGSKLYNHIGTTIKCKRREVDDDHTRDCSYGLHVGTPEFVRMNNFGPVVLLCSVPPEAVVTVPEYDVEKLRTCEYTVVKQVDNPDDFSHILYSNDGNPVESKVVWADPDWEQLSNDFSDDYDDDYDSEIEDYEEYEEEDYLDDSQEDSDNKKKWGFWL